MSLTTGRLLLLLAAYVSRVDVGIILVCQTVVNKPDWGNGPARLG